MCCPQSREALNRRSCPTDLPPAKLEISYLCARSFHIPGERSVKTCFTLRPNQSHTSKFEVEISQVPKLLPNFVPLPTKVQNSINSNSIFCQKLLLNSHHWINRVFSFIMVKQPWGLTAKASTTSASGRHFVCYHTYCILYYLVLISTQVQPKSTSN